MLDRTLYNISVYHFTKSLYVLYKSIHNVHYVTMQEEADKGWDPNAVIY